MTVAEYQQAQKDIAEIRGQIAQLRDVVAKGVPAMRGVYGLDQPEAQQPMAEPQQAPQMMSAHEQVGTPNVNPFQDNFTPSTNVKSMQEIAGQIAPQIDQPLGERIARGAMNLPVGMAAMAEQATSDPAGFAKGTAEYADTWMKRLNPNLMSPEAMVARTEFGQQLATDPVGTGLDALGVAGTALGLPSLGGKIKGFKSIKEARAAIKDIGKPKVDVPEVVQEPIRNETPKVDLSSEKPQPATAQEVVETAKPLINQEAVPAKIRETQAINLDNLLGGKISQQTPIATKKRGASTYDGVRVGDIVVQNREGYTVKVDKLYENGKGEFTVIDAPDGHPWKNELNQGRTVRSSFHQPVTKNFTKLTPSDVPTTATEVVAKADVTKPQTPQAITEDLSQPLGDKVTPSAKPTTAEAVVKKAGEGVERGLKAWADNEIYIDGQGNYRWGKNSTEQRGRIVPFNKELKGRFKDSSELHNAAKAYKDSPTELSAGVNPFKIIDDYMTKRKLVNPLGTPEVVLRGKDIVEPFRSANDLMRDDLTARGEKLKSMLEGVKRESGEDVAIFQKLDDPNANLDVREQAIRDYYNDLFAEVNKHREARGQNPVKFREGYITHLPTDAKMSEILDVLEKATADYGDTPMPKKFRFQFEKARKGDLDYKMSAIDALEVYTQAALKDIYIGDALAKAVPNIDNLGGKPLLVKNVVKTPDGKTINITEYRWTDSPIVTERGYAEAFIKGQMNVPTMGQRTLKAMFDIRPNTSMKVAHATTGAFYRSLLGFAMDSGVKNLTQNLNTLAEYGVAPTLKGAAKFITPEGFKAAKAQHLLDDFNPMLLEGHDLPMKSKVGRAIGKGFAASLNAPMKVAEFINRGIAYHTAFDVNLKKGLPVEAAHDLAREGVRKTQFSYSKMDTSPALRGPSARLATQFLSYPIKQSELMYQWATKPGEQGKLVRYFLYTGMAVVGAKYGGVDLSGVFFDPIKMVDPNSKEGMELPWSDKRVKIDWTKFGQSGYTPRGFTPIISIPKDFVESQMSDDESAREYGRTKALANVLPGGRYGKKVYDVITESDEKGKRDRLTRENTTKDKVLKLLGGKSTDREAESSRRETVNKVEKKYYSTRQKLIDLKISGNEDEFIKLRDEFRDRYPFLYGRLMKGFADAVKEERKKKGMTTDERFFDNSLRKQIDANI